MTIATDSRSHIKDLGLKKLAKETVLSLLAAMPLGRLELVLPDGSRRCFGDGSNGIESQINVYDEEFFLRCLLYADLGLAESYIDGLCELSSIRSVVSWFLLNYSRSPVLSESPATSRLLNILGISNRLGHALRANSKSLSRRNIKEHYDLGNEFFSLFLDRTMTYSSGLFLSPSMLLEEAQNAKFERIVRQLKINRNDRVLDLGCGWGAFTCLCWVCLGVCVTALTISRQQYDYVGELIKKEGLQNLVNLRLEDYRDHQGTYDKIASVEMIEAVGDQYMDVFIAKLDTLLAPDGLLAMQMITCPDSRYKFLKLNVDFIQKHIFPGSLLPSLHRIGKSMLSCGDLFLVDLFDMTESYVQTLRLWQTAFENKLEDVRALGFDEKFIRKWRYYFEYCQAAFAMRNISVVQATYSRPNNLRLNGGTNL